MKRVIILIVAFCFAFCVTAYAETDLSSLSNDDLLLLEAQIKAEKTARGLPASAVLPQGTYKVGTDGDIPAGRYTIMYEYSNKKSSIGDYYWIHITVYDSSEAILLSRDITNEETPHPTYSMELPEGSTLKINNDGAARLIRVHLIF